MSFLAVLFLLVTNPPEGTLQAQDYFVLFKSTRYTDPDLAVHYLDSAISLLDDSKNLSLKAEYIRNKGIHLKNQGDLAKSLELYDQALNLFSISDDSAGIAATYNNIGVSHFRMSNLDSALTSYFRARDINLRNENHSGLAKNYLNIGNVYSRTHQYGEALINYKEADQLLSNVDEPSLSGLVSKNIGLVYSEKDNPDFNASKAITYNQKSIYHYNTVGDSFNIAGLYNNIGLLHENLQELKKAEVNYKESLVISRKKRFNALMADSYFNLGNVYLTQGSTRLARDNYLQSTKLASETGNMGLQRNAVKRLSEVYIKLQVPEEAFRFLSLHDSLNNILFNTEREGIINELEEKYETERREKELAQAQIEIQKRIAERNGYLIALAVFLALSIILILIYQQRQKAIKDLNLKEKVLFENQVNELLLGQEVNTLNAMLDGQEKERKRISSELHDRVGSLLTAAKFSMELNGADSMHKTSNLLGEALEETRNLSHSLASGVLAKFGLIAAINDLKTSLEEDRSIQINFTYNGYEKRVSQEMEIDLYRIVQELISNSLKHARANSITISIDASNNDLVFQYSDDGIGFQTELQHDGIGLKNIDARAKKHNGNLTIESQPTKGMKLILNLEPYLDEKAIAG